MELYQQFSGYDEWKFFARDHPEIFSDEVSRSMLDSIRREGVVEPLTNARHAPEEIIVKGENYRETIRAGRLISRQRALLKVCERLSDAQGHPVLTRKTRIYAPEALTEFALYMRSSYPRFLGSEYAETSEDRSYLFPIQVENLLELSFRASVFDVAFANDVFEHVPDLDVALRELSRVLVPGGLLISTFPFLFQRERGIVKAIATANGIRHIAEPEYHGNPLNPEEGSLVYELPGWDLVDRANRAGFSDASIVLVASSRNGIVGSGINGVFVFVATN